MPSSSIAGWHQVTTGRGRPRTCQCGLHGFENNRQTWLWCICKLEGDGLVQMLYKHDMSKFRVGSKSVVMF